MHRDNCPSHYRVELDAERDFQDYGPNYRRYYDGCHEAERWHEDEMRRLHDEAMAEQRRQERREAEQREAEYWAEEARRAEEEEYWREQERQYHEMAEEDPEVQASGPGHDVR